jgi:hypothetical protein
MSPQQAKSSEKSRDDLAEESKPGFRVSVCRKCPFVQSLFGRCDIH